MRKKRFLPILIAFVVICSLVGCQTDDGGAETSATSEMTTSISQNEETLPNDLKPPDWSIDEFAKNIELNGIKLSLPCTLDELKQNLGDEYSFDNPIKTDDLNIKDCYKLNLIYNETC